jgi:hypothetical protein
MGSSIRGPRERSPPGPFPPPVPTSKIPDTNATLESADLSEGYVVGPDSQTVTLIHSGRVCAISLGWRFSRYEVGVGVLESRDQCALFSPVCWDDMAQAPI